MVHWWGSVTLIVVVFLTILSPEYAFNIAPVYQHDMIVLSMSDVYILIHHFCVVQLFPLFGSPQPSPLLGFFDPQGLCTVGLHVYRPTRTEWFPKVW